MTLVVKTSSDPAFEGSTMNETIRSADVTTLALESSIATCAGHEVRLAKQ